MNAKFLQNTIAMVYDFDGTLSPQPMQEYTVLPEIGVKPDEFWEKVNRESKETISESMLVYMRLLLEEADSRHVHIGREDFALLAKNIKYFAGVENWFPMINRYVRDKSKGRVKLNHWSASNLKCNTCREVKCCDGNELQALEL